MPEELRTLFLVVILQNAVLATLTIGLYWAGIFVARRFGSGAGYSLAALGLVRPRNGFLTGAAVGFVIGLAAILMSLLVSGLSAVVLENLGYSADNSAQEPLMSGLRTWVSENPAIAIPAAFLVVALVGPAVEELVFRGALFGGLYRLGTLLARRAGPRKDGRGAEWGAFLGAALISSALFAALHLSPVIIPAIFVLAIILCALYRRTGSLLPPFVAHATFNSFTTLLIVLSSLGVFEVPVYSVLQGK